MLNFLKLFSKSQCSVKHMACILFSISICALLHIWVMNNTILSLDNLTSILSFTRPEESESFSTPAKYILSWHGSWIDELIDYDTATSKCSAHCIFTRNRKLLGGDEMLFQAILFNEQVFKSTETRPSNRSSSQMYIFSSLESAYNYPSCELRDDHFFNWTFTYRLDSDVLWSYFTVTNASGTAIAPSTNVEWETSVDRIKPEIKTILLHKTKAAAWLVSHCGADSLRDNYLSELQKHLYHYSIEIDVYGDCSKNKCSYESCEKMLRKDYFFYMAFENSISEDYVTEKVLHGFDNYAVPIVYGGANYSRFLPPGSYINAREIHPYNLAYAVHQAIKDPILYETYFRWTNLYTFTAFDSIKDSPRCRLCKALYTDKAQHAPVKKNFRVWWNGRNGMKWCLSHQYWIERSRLNIDAKDVFRLY